MKLFVTLITEDGKRILEAEKGERLSSLFRRYEISVDMPCGGRGTCRNCSVSVDGKACLACQMTVEGNLRIQLMGVSPMNQIVTGQVSNLPPVDPLFTQYGLSVDIGTTTLCATLFDFLGQADTVTRKNPQTAFGADVISRIQHALEGGTEALAHGICQGLTEMIEALCSRRGITALSIDGLVISGNTSMLYLLTGQNPLSLSRAPFSADRLFGEFVPADSLNLPVAPHARIYLPPCASAFVGADIACAILSSGMCRKGETALLVDMGTNGEVVLWKDGALTCCSTAAGPALEGMGITHGSYGVNGAIDRVWMEDGRLRCSTIGGDSAVGICGSGIVDAVALMLELGVIEESGAFSNDSNWFPLEDDIGVTGADVRQVQLAKGAIRAGIETLLKVAGLTQADVDTLYIAGGFGSKVSLAHLGKIGLIPPEMTGRAQVIGNAAHTGASMLLQNRGLIEGVHSFVTQANTVSLDGNPIFVEKYMAYMLFD